MQVWRMRNSWPESSHMPLCTGRETWVIKLIYSQFRGKTSYEKIDSKLNVSVVDILSCLSYMKGVTGENCNLLSNMTNPCSVNPCFGQSACINLSNNKFVCICRSGRSGPTCKGHIAPCQCTSHGKCRLIELDVFACDCDEGYGWVLVLLKQNKIGERSIEWSTTVCKLYVFSNWKKIVLFPNRF